MKKTKISLKGKLGLENYFIPLWYLGIVALTFVLSLFTIGFDFTELGSASYWGNLAINYCLAIVSLLAATKDGNDKGKRKDDYKSSLARLEEIINLINVRGLSFLLPDYLTHKYEADKSSFIKSTLSANAIKDEYLQYGTRYLKKHRKDLDLSNDQLSVLLRIKKGKIKIRKVSTSDLMCSKSADSQSSLGPTYSMGKRQMDLTLPRLIMMLVVSALFASVGLDVATESNVGSTVLNLMMRLFTVLTSIASGYMNGFTIDRELAIVNSKREDILRVFIQKIDTGEYVPQLNEGAKIPDHQIAEKTVLEVVEEEPVEEDEYEIVEMTVEEAEKLISKGD